MDISGNIFKGEIPILANDELSNNDAQIANNCKLVSKELRSFQGPLLTEAISETTANTIFRWDANGEQYWCISSNILDHVRSPVKGEVYERIYYTGESEPRFLANDNISVPFDFTTDYYKLGVPKPTAAPTVTPSAAGAVYRGYAYTYLNEYGEEGVPSAVGSTTTYTASTRMFIDDIVNAPADRAINRIRVYRTQTSTDLVTAFQLVCTAKFFDTATAYAVGDFVVYLTDLYECTTIHPAGAWNGAHFTKGELVVDPGIVIPSGSYDVLPDDADGLILLPNGVGAAFVDNDVYLSEPYLLHAYPSEYIVPYGETIVGLGQIGNTIIVLTDAHVHYLYGTHPSSMSSRRSKNFPCKSKQSISSEGDFVNFASKESLVTVSINDAKSATSNIFDKVDWEALSPAQMNGAYHEDSYFFFNNVKGGMLDFDHDIYVPLGLVVHSSYISPGGQFFLAMDYPDGVDQDNPPANMPLAIYEWEQDTQNYMFYTWRGKLHLLSKDINFFLARVVVDIDFYNEVIALIDLATINASNFSGDIEGALGERPLGSLTLGGDILKDLEDFKINANTNFKLYENSVLKYSVTLSGSDNIFPLPKGFTGKAYEVQIEGYLPIKRYSVATSPQELR